MKHALRLVAHHAGDITAAFLFPICGAFFDAFGGEHREQTTVKHDG